MRKLFASIQFSDSILKTCKIVLVLAFAVSLCFVVSKADAAGSYYTFQGNITTVDNFYGLLNPDISVGDQVTYTFFIDFATNGTYTRNNGEVLIASDTPSYDYFYTDYISGDAFDELSDGGSHNVWYEIAETNYGSEQLSGPSPLKYGIYGNSNDNFISISGNSFNPGDSFSTYNEVYNTSGLNSYIYADVSLQSVSASLPVVPEPVSSTLFIVGGATLGFRRFRKKFRK